MLLWSVQVGFPEAVMGRVHCVCMYMLTLSTGTLSVPGAGEHGH